MVKRQVFNRLYQRGQESLSRRDKLNEERSKVISSECTFSPDLSLNKKKRSRPRARIAFTVADSVNALVASVEALAGQATVAADAYARRYRFEATEALGRRKHAVDAARRAEAEADALAEKAGRGGKRFHRLYNDAFDRMQRIDHAHYEKTSRLPDEYTFKPRVRRRRQGAPPDAPASPDEKFAGVLKRNQDYAARRKQFLRESLKRKPHGCTFSPSVNRAAAVGKAKKSASEKTAQRCARLYEQGEKDRKARKGEIEKQKIERRKRREEETPSVWGSPVVRGGGARRPGPTPPSKKKKATVPESTASRGGKASAARSASRANDSAMAQCTFRPRINRASRKIAKPGKIHERLYKDGKAHLDRSISREKENPTGCTFKPTLSGTRAEGGRTVAEAGERLYAESKDRLRRRDEAHSQLPPQCTFSPEITGSRGGAASYKPARPMGRRKMSPTVAAEAVAAEGARSGSTPGEEARSGSTTEEGARSGSTPGEGARSGSTPGEGDAGVPVEVADKVSNAGDFVLPTDEDEMVGGEEAFYKNIQGRQ
jgi:hypothetical protein